MLSCGCEEGRSFFSITSRGPKKTGILGGKRYKEKILDIVQDFNARQTALRATISPNTNFDPTILKKVIRVTVLGLFGGWF